MAASTKAAARHIRLAERRARVLALRASGCSLRAIARQIGTSHELVRLDLKAELHNYEFQQQESISELLRLEQARLDAACIALYPSVKDGDLASIDAWIRVSESRRRLLGLDRPVERRVRV